MLHPGNKLFSRGGQSRAIGALALAASFYACVPASSVFNGDPDLRTSQSAAAITVSNQHRAPVNVYVVVGASRYRLGEVATSATRTFSLPRAIALPSEVGFFVASIADGEEYLSSPIIVGAGGSILLNVESPARYSTIFRR